jgi:hypothetical protein
MSWKRPKESYAGPHISGALIDLSEHWRPCDCRRPCYLCPFYSWKDCLIDVIGALPEHGDKK